MTERQRDLMLMVIKNFAFMKVGRPEQLQIIESSIGARKNVTELSETELRVVLHDITGEDVTL